MPAVARVGIDTVFFGPGAEFPGAITGQLGIDQYCDSDLISCVGDSIAPHGPPPHDAAVMVQGSLDTFVNGIPICRMGDLASCQCYVISGSPDTFCI
jgi:uncharacterized Zn-binding protein involved in type VI secretion